jgi:hypothetical protein
MSLPVSQTEKNAKRKEVSENAKDKIVQCEKSSVSYMFHQMAMPLIMMYHHGK